MAKLTYIVKAHWEEILPLRDKVIVDGQAFLHFTTNDYYVLQFSNSKERDEAFKNCKQLGGTAFFEDNESGITFARVFYPEKMEKNLWDFYATMFNYTGRR